MGGWRSWKDPFDLVLSSFREQIPEGSARIRKQRAAMHLEEQQVLGGGLSVLKTSLLKQGKGHTNCFSIHFHAGRGNNGRGAAGKGLCHGYRPVAENVGGAVLVQS